MLREIKERKQKAERRLRNSEKTLNSLKAQNKYIKSDIKLLFKENDEIVELMYKELTEQKNSMINITAIIAVFLVVIIIFGISAKMHTQNQINDLEEQIYLKQEKNGDLQNQILELQKEIEKMQEKVNTVSIIVGTQNNLNATEIFANAVLPMEEGKMYDENGNTFYYDPDCKETISEPIFCSDWRTYGIDSKGNAIWIYRLTNGDFAYIPSNFNVDIVNLN